MITSEQSKAARSLLNWSAKDLAINAGISNSVITKFEKYKSTINADTLSKIQKAYKKSGIRFIGNRGVELLAETSEVLQGDDCVEQLWELILDSFEGLDGGGLMGLHHHTVLKDISR